MFLKRHVPTLEQRLQSLQSAWLTKAARSELAAPHLHLPLAAGADFFTTASLLFYYCLGDADLRLPLAAGAPKKRHCLFLSLRACFKAALRLH